MSMPVKVVLSLFFVCAAVWGQANTAQINGNVRDASGLAVPRRNGCWRRKHQREQREPRPAARMAPSFCPILPIGPYTLDISKPGFAKVRPERNRPTG